jgi:hypothetical protein
MSCILAQRAKQDRPTPAALRADLVGIGLIIIGDLSACSATPILAACGQLVELGIDPRTPLHCCRGGQLAVIVRGIGEAARLEINGNGGGIGFVRRRGAMVAASPVRNSEKSEPNYPAQINAPVSL